MYKFILSLCLTIFSSHLYAQPQQDRSKIENVFSNDILKLDFPDGLTLSSMAVITKKNGYKIYFDDNVDSNLSIEQKNTKIKSLDLFNSYIKKFNLKYKIEYNFLVHIYKDENHNNKLPYSYNSFFFVSNEKYGCYSKVYDIMDQNGMKLIMRDSVDQSIEEYGFDVIPINAVYKQSRVNFTCITKDDKDEFVSLTVTGFDYPEIILQSALLEEELKK